MQNSSPISEDPAVLMEKLSCLELKLKKRNAQLHRTRMRLNTAKGKLVKLKETVAFQRQRILELHH